MSGEDDEYLVSKSVEGGSINLIEMFQDWGVWFGNIYRGG